MTGGMDGVTVVVTGATSGMGRAMARDLVGRGADVIVVGRDARRVRRTADELGGHRVVGRYEADLSRHAEVRGLAVALAADGHRVDVLVNNAGAAFDRYALTPDGVERTHALNLHAPVLLSHALAANGVLVPEARVITMSSFMEKQGRVAPTDPDVRGTSWAGRRWSQNRVYATSKLLALLAMNGFSRSAPGLRVYNADPGMVRTGFTGTAGGAMALVAPLTRLFARTVEEGVATPLILATSRPAPAAGDGYFASSRPATPSRTARDAALAELVHRRTAEAVGITP
ncbi:SDR family NAD(P)-dependent oxidoreductase [Pseudonocardia sp. ICBG162]|uniref:SDR family NAD(P)-dependent oxidoreductase n=1 Tax=Pseudonocardia sp. ICBG162 TaxID=2846761 RepID=UPI001CF6AAD7|nr:SDR family NAD(P)-dependent oxidoreductase [Pseudonocardia sp. ICBG162]